MKAIGGPHAPAGRTHAVQCVDVCTTCLRDVRDGDGDDDSDGGLLGDRENEIDNEQEALSNTATAAGRKKRLQTNRHRSGAVGGYSRHRQNRKRRAEKGAGVLTSRYFAPEAGTRSIEAAPPRNSIQLKAPAPRVSVTHHASRITPLRMVGIRPPGVASSAARGARQGCELSELELELRQPVRERVQRKRG